MGSRVPGVRKGRTSEWESGVEAGRVESLAAFSRKPKVKNPINPFGIPSKNPYSPNLKSLTP